MIHWKFWKLFEPQIKGDEQRITQIVEMKNLVNLIDLDLENNT